MVLIEELKKGQIRDINKYMSAAINKRLERFILPGKVSFSDIDGILEKNGKFLALEHKYHNDEIPLGQKILLENLSDVPQFTVIIYTTYIDGEFCSWDYIRKGKKLRLTQEKSEESLNEIINDWFAWASETQNIKPAAPYAPIFWPQQVGV